MKRNSDHPYHYLISFNDLALEKERLILKSRLIEAKIDLEIIMIRNTFSFSNLVVSLIGEAFLPKISGLLSVFFKKEDSL